MRKNLLCLICNCALLLLSAGTSQAQVKGNPELKAVAPSQPGIEKSTSKLSAHLNRLYDNSIPGAKKPDARAKPVLQNNGLDKYIQIKGDMVLVDITVKGDINNTRSELEKLGLKVTGAFGRVISGMIPIKALPQLESTSSVQFVQPAFKPLHQSKPLSYSMNRSTTEKKLTPVISQGDTAQRSFIARKKYDVNGKGVKVGIMSDSYNNLGTADSGVLRGELPGPGNPFNFKKPVQILNDSDSTGLDEGRAMAEIVHDVAPGAELAFKTAFLGSAAFAQGILDLANVGCKVITDDVIYFAEPFFQDGIIAQAVDIAKKRGVTYFSSAGNLSVRSYESDYRASEFSPFGPDFGTAHNFSAKGDAPRYFQPIYIPTNGNFVLSLQWDQPFFSAGGAGSESDLDIYLLDSQGQIVAAGNSFNILTGDPVELFGYVNDTKSNTFFLVILKFEGPDPTHLKYIFFGDGLFYLTNPPIPGILAPTLVGHAKAEGAIATAASFYLQTPAYGADTPVVDFYSSVGGVANYFDTQGNRIHPVIRKKPEITAPDGGNTSFFDPFGNGDITEDSDKFPNFFGTSAASPHAAGVAALMIEAQKLKTITPSQIKGLIATNAIDMDNLYTPGFDKGFDFNTGKGLLKADAAVKVVKFPNLYIKNLKLEAICSNDPANTRNWKVINHNPFEVDAKWFLIGSSQQDKIVVPPGGITFTTKTSYFQNRPLPNVAVIEWEDNFGFSRFDAAFSTLAKCGKDGVSENKSEKMPEGDIAEEITTKPNIAEVYPNPSSKYFRLYLSFNNQQNAEIELYSIDGKQLFKRTVQPNGIVDIDASNYRPGVYMLKVRQSNFNKTIKLIRQ